MYRDKLIERTKLFAISCINFLKDFPYSREGEIIRKQLIRSSTSIGANYRAANLARSKREFYAKICIVLEETDETVYWLEILEDSGLGNSEEILPIKNEAKELLFIFSKTRKSVKLSLNPTKNSI